MWPVGTQWWGDQIMSNLQENYISVSTFNKTQSMYFEPKIHWKLS